MNRNEFDVLIASSSSNGERRPSIKPQKCLKPLLPNTKSNRTSAKMIKKGTLIRRGYSGGAWGVVRPIKLNQWDTWGAVFFLKSGLYWDKF